MFRNGLVEIVAVLVIAATACSDEARGNAGSTTDPVEVSIAAEIAELSANPLGDFLSGGRSPEEEFRLIEQQIAQCMSERGWEYTAITVPGTAIVQPRTVAELQEYRSTYGYGFATQELGLQSGERGSMIPDPNEPYVNNLSDAEKQQFFIDKEGTFLGEATTEERASSCRGEAEKAVLPNSPIYDPSVQSQVPAIQERMDTDQALRDALTRWKSCMNEHGYEFNDLSEPSAFIAEQVASTNDLDQLANDEVRLAVQDFNCQYPDIFVARNEAVASALEELNLS